MEDLMGTLLELRGQYRKLQWYGEVNRRGFVKITKKLDKQIPSSATQSRYLANKVDPKSFATNNKLTRDMRAINEWLSSLAEVKVVDDASSIHSGSSGNLNRMGPKSNFKIPIGTLESLDQAIREDDGAKVLEIAATAIPNPSQSVHNTLLLDLLQRSISISAYKCMEAIIAQISSIDAEDDITKRNCLHKFLIAIGRSRALEKSGSPTEVAQTTYINAAVPPVRAPGGFNVEERKPGQSLSKDDEAVQVLSFVLDHLRESHHSAVLAKDDYGRMPIHYAAQYGLCRACQTLMKHMQDWNIFDVLDGIDSAAWQDLDGYAPVHLAVIGGHYRTSRALLLVDEQHTFKNTRLNGTHVSMSGVCLALATKSNYNRIVNLLVDAGVDVNFQDQQGETALHIAARFGHEDCARALLASRSEGHLVDTELAEKSYGWTPLFTASVNGQLSVVKLLVDAGAQITKLDSSGWTSQEHAALRGHLGIARYLAKFTPPPSSHASSPENIDESSSPPDDTSSFEERRADRVHKEHVHANYRASEPVKSFGHRYLTEESMVLVTLGTLDERKDLGPVSFENIAMADAHATQLDTALSLVISAQGAKGEPTVIDLPIQEEINTSPLTFTTTDASKVKILFDLVPTYAGATDNVIARAVAILSSIRPGLGSKRMTLQTDLSVPLIAGKTLDVIGSINFNFLIITPFKHANMSISEEKTYWTKSSTMVIGHRGLGKNMATKTSLQLGENTIQSFVTAANLGASYVEFDVQMTKDHVPVIYHDFLVSETGADVPVHTLTLEQFLSLSQTPKPTPPHSPIVLPDRSSRHSDRRAHVQRSYSLGAPEHDQMRERMKYTRDFKLKGFKGNSRGDFIQSPFTTLEEMLRTMPDDVGFNIEMKYPMLFESVEQEMDAYAVEINSFVDTVLAMVYDLRKKRNVVFSSFHPDICLLLTFKQPSIPVLFLTDAGVSPVGDVRASSLQEAIRFASRWNLLGIVSSAEPLVLCPHLIHVVQSSELVCISYGTLNNDPHNSNLQAQAGIDAVIVDSVARVRQGLTEAEAGSGGGGNGTASAVKIVSSGDVVLPERVKVQP